MQRWENGRSKERDYGAEVATEGRREVEGKEDGGVDLRGKWKRRGDRDGGREARTEGQG